MSENLLYGTTNGLHLVSAKDGFTVNLPSSRIFDAALGHFSASIDSENPVGCASVRDGILGLWRHDGFVCVIARQPGHKQTFGFRIRPDGSGWSLTNGENFCKDNNAPAEVKELLTKKESL
jgi:hypothetical protein